MLTSGKIISLFIIQRAQKSETLVKFQVSIMYTKERKNLLEFVLKSVVGYLTLYMAFFLFIYLFPESTYLAEKDRQEILKIPNYIIL